MRIDSTVRSDPLRRRLRRLGRFERREEARAFVDSFHREHGLPDAARLRRRREVLRDLARHGHYEHTPEELAYGARVAWRNHARCVGRLLWRSLDVVDCRSLVGPEAIAARMADHLREAGGQGPIRSVISVFPPVRGEKDLPAYIESRQVVQYAGYADETGRIVGDPIAMETTRIALSLGWRPPTEPGPFDVLPLLVRDGRGRRSIHELPPDSYREVTIGHPRHPGLAALGLRWFTVPCVSSMILTIGGVDYPCAPFNGHYLATEIASRNLAEERRYDLLPRVADALGIDRDALWKDRALTELNLAVLHSFRAAGATIVDHHEVSEQYMLFVQREAAEGRTASGDWSWIVPPQASAACPVFHLAMRDRGLVPNYYVSRAGDGGRLGVNYDDEPRCPLRRRWDRMRRRWYDWWRRRD